MESSDSSSREVLVHNMELDQVGTLGLENMNSEIYKEPEDWVHIEDETTWWEDIWWGPVGQDSKQVAKKNKNEKNYETTREIENSRDQNVQHYKDLNVICNANVLLPQPTWFAPKRD